MNRGVVTGCEWRVAQQQVDVKDHASVSGRIPRAVRIGAPKIPLRPINFESEVSEPRSPWGTT
jgi:hypothetical protein